MSDGVVAMAGYDYGDGIGTGSGALLGVLVAVSAAVVGGFVYVLLRVLGRQDGSNGNKGNADGLARRHAQRQALRQRNDDEGEEDEEEGEDEDGAAAAGAGAAGAAAGRVSAARLRKKGKRYLAKQQAKEERREANRVRAEALEADRRARAEAEARDAERRAAERAAEAARRAAERRAREDLERAEAAEYAAWRQRIEPVGGGDAVRDARALDALRPAIAEYVVARKRVDVAALAATFRVRPEEAVRQLRAIERAEEARPRGDGEARFAAGVLDERGTYLVLTEAEVAAIARDIEDAGRVTLADIVRIANARITVPEPPRDDDAIDEDTIDDGSAVEEPVQA